MTLQHSDILLITFFKCILQFSTRITAFPAVLCAGNNMDLKGLLCVNEVIIHTQNNSSACNYVFMELCFCLHTIIEKVILQKHQCLALVWSHYPRSIALLRVAAEMFYLHLSLYATTALPHSYLLMFLSLSLLCPSGRTWDPGSCGSQSKS